MEKPNMPTAVADAAAKPNEPPLARYFMMKGGQRHGPLTPRQMVDLGLTATHAVWREGLAGWTRAEELPELANLTGKLPPSQTHVAEKMLPSPATPRCPSMAAAYSTRAIRITTNVFGSFRKLDLRREIWPLDGVAARTMASDPTFWWVTLLAALPLLFATLNDPDQMLTAFSLFFAGMWALIFCYVVKGEQVGWGWRIACFLFTGVLGIGGLTLVYKLLPALYMTLHESSSFGVSVLGYVAQVGLFEEAVKAVPVVAALLFLRRRLNHADVVLLGIFSGLGFSAFENLSYFHEQLVSSIHGAVDAVTAASNNDVSGDTALGHLANGAYITMLMPLARSLASPLGHAVWSGIVAHFLSVSVLPDAADRRWALALSGLGIAAVLHGLYDALFAIQLGLPAVIAVVSFMLLRMYLEGGERSTAAVEVVAPTFVAPQNDESLIVSEAAAG